MSKSCCWILIVKLWICSCPCRREVSGSITPRAGAGVREDANHKEESWFPDTTDMASEICINLRIFFLYSIKDFVMARIKYIDLFSGIGGFALGLQKAGIEFDKHYFSEIDKNAISVYKKNFPSAEALGDVTTIRNFSGISADLITFGFPCQDLSYAGKRKGLAGARSGLFFEALRIIRQVKPKHFIFENVKGLFTSDGGADFVRCLREIADIELYDCEWQLVNTSWILPQNRERIYFIGHLRSESSPKVFPIREQTAENNQFVKKRGEI